MGGTGIPRSPGAGRLAKMRAAPAHCLPMIDAARRGARRANLKRVLYPRHVAYVGGRAVEESIAMLRSADFPGPIWPVNPKHDFIAGLPAFKSVSELPEGPDVAFLYVPKVITLDVLRQLAAHGAGGAVCFAAGYAELGDTGRGQQNVLAEAAGDLAVLGPNSNGFLNYLDGAALWSVADHKPRAMTSGVAIVSSSGGVLFNYSVNQRSVGAALMIGAGNQAVCDFSDFVDVLADDERITAIGLFAEDLGDIPSFSAATAKALTNNIPVVALKTGSSEIGAMMASTHSGALAADDNWVEALFERNGVIRVRSLPELDETLKMVTTTAIPKGRRMAVLTNSGGEKALAADATEGRVMELVPPSLEARVKLARIIPDFATVSNPFDYNAYFAGSGKDVLAEDNPAKLEHCFRTMVDDGYDVAMMLHGTRTHPGGAVEDPGNTPTCWSAANRGSGRAVVQCAGMPEHMPESLRGFLIESGIAPLQGLNEAMAAVDGAIRWGEARATQRDAGSLGLPPVPSIPSRGTLWDEAASKAALAAHGLVVPNHLVVAPGEAAEAAGRIGFPVALKAADPVFAHKEKAGAVALNLRSSADVADAAAAMADRLAQAGTLMRRVFVEAMVADPRHELFVGVAFDRRFGHGLLFGRGGSEVERLGDTALALLPLGAAALQRIAHSRGLTDAVACKVRKALEAVVRFAAANRERLVSLDVNPLIVTGSGDVVAVDALIETAD